MVVHSFVAVAGKAGDGQVKCDFIWYNWMAANMSSHFTIKAPRGNARRECKTGLTSHFMTVKETAANVDDAVRELPDANLKLEDLWINHSKAVHPKPPGRTTLLGGLFKRYPTLHVMGF
ncbi:Phototropin-1 [Camellia lanceoleosa]|uniref:Phototropin-1 n=1 Tax=Camellia lanceoleosa TaxID=1840588 RepID=A0ACC0FMR0_9ERIC|nr:Phototropin-1 [Camellia lanceoleosa]